MLDPNFNDLQNIETIIKNESIESTNKVVENPLGFANSVSSASLRYPYYLNEKLS